MDWRTRLSIRWARARRWEFWSGWIVYAPIVAYIVWYAGLRRRPFAAFTAVNPGMSGAGGLIGEAKSELLPALAEHHPAYCAAFARVDPGLSIHERVQVALDFQAGLPRAWPLVLKPDVSERGRGVRIAHSVGAIRDYFQRFHRAVLVQAYAPGDEFGVFYLRYPDAAQGQLFSITEKAFPQVLGDGRRSLGTLILGDARARLHAEMLFERFAATIDQVPAVGQGVTLADVGSHCRGSTFLDARALATPELLARFDALAADLPGFHFGRFDLRAESSKALAEARDFKIIEINGASSEPAHAYHPGTPLWTGLRAFCASWRHMTDIGCANVARGATRLSAWELAMLPLRERQALRGLDWPENVWSGEDQVRFGAPPTQCCTDE